MCRKKDMHGVRFCKTFVQEATGTIKTIPSLIDNATWWALTSLNLSRLHPSSHSSRLRSLSFGLGFPSKPRSPSCPAHPLPRPSPHHIHLLLLWSPYVRRYLPRPKLPICGHRILWLGKVLFAADWCWGWELTGKRPRGCDRETRGSHTST